jgi:hypothetical protein
MRGLTRFLQWRLDDGKQAVPKALVVMAESAIPTDASDFLPTWNDKTQERVETGRYKVGLTYAETCCMRCGRM